MIAANEIFPVEVSDSVFQLVFVYNPWDLQISSWHHIGCDKQGVLQGIPAVENCLKLKSDPDRPHDFILDISRELQSDDVVAPDGNAAVDFIARHERLQEDFNAICERIGIPRTHPPHERLAQGRSDCRRYHAGVTAELVAEHCVAAIARFGSRFDAC